MADSNNTTKLLTAIVAPMQSLEDALMSLMIERRISTAVGEQLDVLGRIVVQPRAGLDDDDYRRYIRARVVTNKSDGLVEDLIRIVSLLLDDENAVIHVSDEDMATVIVRSEGVEVPGDLADSVIRFLRAAKSGGVRLIFEYWPSGTEDLMFVFGDVGGSVVGEGFGSTADASLGGDLAGAIV